MFGYVAAAFTALSAILALLLHLERNKRIRMERLQAEAAEKAAEQIALRKAMQKAADERAKAKDRVITALEERNRRYSQISETQLAAKVEAAKREATLNVDAGNLNAVADALNARP